MIPVKVTGIRKNKSAYAYKSHVPISKLGISNPSIALNLNSHERKEAVKNKY